MNESEQHRQFAATCGIQMVESGAEARRLVRDAQHAGKTVGLVPTMGALHEGHLSLVRRAKNECDLTAATIFVNPLQFGPQEDLSKYPRTLRADLEKLGSCGTDIVFVPTVGEMYPPGFSTHVEPPAVSKLWEGQCRPGHFRGVCTVVLKLFELLPADVAFFGHKDYQQSLVIRHMVRDFNLAIRIQVCETVREPDGLAMSSRNVYLSPAERERALAISQSLRWASDQAVAGNTDYDSLCQSIRGKLLQAGIDKIEYVAAVDPETLEARSGLEMKASAASRMIVLIAAFVGKTRLIDNWRIG